MDGKLLLYAETPVLMSYLSANVSDGALSDKLPSSVGSEIQLEGYEFVNILLGS